MTPENIMVWVVSLVVLFLIAFFFMFLTVMVIAVGADSVLSRFGIDWLNEEERPSGVAKKGDIKGEEWVNRYGEPALRKEMDDMFKTSEWDLKITGKNAEEDNKNA